MALTETQKEKIRDLDLDSILIRTLQFEYNLLMDNLDQQESYIHKKIKEIPALEGLNQDKLNYINELDTILINKELLRDTFADFDLKRLQHLKAEVAETDATESEMISVIGVFQKVFERLEQSFEKTDFKTLDPVFYNFIEDTINTFNALVTHQISVIQAKENGLDPEEFELLKQHADDVLSLESEIKSLDRRIKQEDQNFFKSLEDNNPNLEKIDEIFNKILSLEKHKYLLKRHYNTLKPLLDKLIKKFEKYLTEEQLAQLSSTATSNDHSIPKDFNQRMQQPTVSPPLGHKEQPVSIQKEKMRKYQSP